MGEWAPLGPAADPVERPLVLVEGARVPGPQAKLTASQHIHTHTHMTEGFSLNHSISCKGLTILLHGCQVHLDKKWQHTMKVGGFPYFPTEKMAFEIQFLARAQQFGMPAVSMSEKLKDHQKSLLCGKYHVTYTNLGHLAERDKTPWKNIRHTKF